MCMTFRTELPLLQTRHACLLQNLGQKEPKSEARSAVRRSYTPTHWVFLF